MKGSYLLAMVSLAGFGLAILTIIHDDQPVAVTTRPMLRMEPPFDSYVAGTGVVESRSKDIIVGSSVSGLIRNVYVKSGDIIKKGALLFSIDDRTVQASLLTAKERVRVAKAVLHKVQDQFDLLEALQRVTPGIVTKESYIAHKDDVALAKASLRVAVAESTRSLKESETYTVYAPIDSKVLQCSINEGEYFGPNSSSHLILGSIDRNLRVDINEYDAWRFKSHTKAVAFVRGHPESKVPLHYAYTEPYIVPKTSLSGSSTEKTDTRVLQVVYSLKEADVPLYIGQQLDVFIEAR